MNDLKVYLVCVAKLENLYIEEFINYYLKLGIDKIIIYDNNDIDGEKISDIINSNYVDIIDFRGNKTNINGQFFQDIIYLEAYKKYSNECDWICFFDVDEFLILEDKYKNIKEFLSDKIFENYDEIKLVWKIYNDNNLVHYENKPLIERFKEISKKNDKQVKTIIKTKKQIRAINCHGKTIPYLRICNTEGIECNYLNIRHGNYIDIPSYKNAWINHYRLKTIEEFINTKFKISVLYKENLNMFFNINDKTKEKLDYIKSLGIDYE